MLRARRTVLIPSVASWVESFIALQGQAVLANALQNINKLDSQKRFHDPNANQLEAEILKTIRTLFSTEVGAFDAMANNSSISAIVASLTSPQLPTRKVAVELLLFFIIRDKPVGLNLVLKGFDDLQHSRGGLGRFEVWFQYFEEALDGRGKMGSAVGASEAVMSLRGSSIARESARMTANGQMGVLDNNLSEYAVSCLTCACHRSPETDPCWLVCDQTTNMLLISNLISEARDLTVRVHLRAQMEVSGLRRILDKLAVFDHPNLRRMVSDFIEDSAADDADVAEDFKEDVLMNFSDPKGVFDAIVVNTEGRAFDFFTSAMKHLLLIPKEPDMRLRYFQLIDTVVSSVVTDRKGLNGDFSALVGSSVASIAARFGDQDRLQEAIEDAADAKATVIKLKREQEALKEEIAQKDQGLVGKLKSRVDNLERALKTSRSATDTIKAELAGNERIYQEKIVSLDLQNRELFTMLEETKALDSIAGEDKGILPRQELVDLLRKREERKKAVRKLEGSPRTKSGVQSNNATSQARGSAEVAMHQQLASTTVLVSLFLLYSTLDQHC